MLFSRLLFLLLLMFIILVTQCLYKNAKVHTVHITLRKLLYVISCVIYLFSLSYIDSICLLLLLFFMTFPTDQNQQGFCLDYSRTSRKSAFLNNFVEMN